MIQSLCLLGSFRAYADHPAKVPKKAKAVLALLALADLNGEGMSRERLSTMLWPYQQSEQARHSLRNCLLEVRKAMRANDDIIKTLVTDFINCRLYLPTDVSDFALLEKSNDQNDLAVTASLYRGELLEDFAIDSEPFEDWLKIEREQWRLRIIAVLLKLSAIASSNGDHDMAIKSARRLVHIDPWNEEAHRLLIGLLHSNGQRGAAHRQFHHCCQTLKRELGIDPEPATAELGRRLSDGRPLTSPAAIFAAIRLEQPCESPRAKKLETARAELDTRAQLAKSLEIGASQIEGLRRDRAVMGKVLARLERIIELRHPRPSPALESMRDELRKRLNSADHSELLPAPRWNGKDSIELGLVA